jgi:hypothetical protein
MQDRSVIKKELKSQVASPETWRRLVAMKEFVSRLGTSDPGESVAGESDRASSCGGGGGGGGGSCGSCRVSRLEEQSD